MAKTTAAPLPPLNTEVLGRLLDRPVAVRPLPLLLYYPRGAVAWEAVKGAMGAGGALVVIVFLHPATPVIWLFSLVGAFFLAYLLRQVIRLLVRLRLDEQELVEEWGGFRRTVRWDTLVFFKLGFFRRERGAASGTFTLTLKGAGGRFRLESSLNEFPTLLARAAAACRKQGLALEPSTEANLEQLGL